MFEAIYYPYASIKNEQTLKRCLFYLDKIYVLTPDASTIYRNQNDLLNLRRDVTGFDSIFKRVDEDVSGINSLFKGVDENEIRKIIEPIYPKDILLKYEDEFSLAVTEDLRDVKFRRLCKQRDYWTIYAEKLPKIGKVPFMHKVLERNDHIAKVEGDFGESVILNHVIYACLDKNIPPLTDEPEHSKILTYKMKRNYDLCKDFLYEQGYIEDLKQQLLVKKVIEKRLYGLENVNIGDIISYREDHKKEFKRFSVEMGKVSNDIKSIPIDLEFESEISQIVKDKIDPSIEELNASIQDFREELATKLVSKIVPIAITFSVTAFSAGWEVGILSSSLVNLMLPRIHKDGMDLIGTLLDYWQQNRRFERNSLYYLIDIENKFSKQDNKFDKSEDKTNTDENKLNRR